MYHRWITGESMIVLGSDERCEWKLSIDFSYPPSIFLPSVLLREHIAHIFTFLSDFSRFFFLFFLFSLFSFPLFFFFLQGGRTVDREQKYSFHGLLVVWKIAGLRLRNCARNFGICGRLKLKILRLWNIRKLEVSAIFTKLYLPTQIL